MVDDNTTGARLVDVLASRPLHPAQGTRPLNLPKYVFLMASTPEARKKAIEVADLMQTIDHTTFIDDFEAPIYEAFRVMFDRDHAKDYGDPKNTQALMLEAKVEVDEATAIASLREWFHKTFSPETLGKMGHKRAVDQQALTDYIYVFRDAQLSYLKAFMSDPMIRPGKDTLVWAIDAAREAADLLLDMEAAS